MQLTIPLWISQGGRLIEAGGVVRGVVNTVYMTFTWAV